jgi:hypothetical protein
LAIKQSFFLKKQKFNHNKRRKKMSEQNAEKEVEGDVCNQNDNDDTISSNVYDNCPLEPGKDAGW